MCTFIFESYWSFWVALVGCTFWVVCLCNSHSCVTYYPLRLCDLIPSAQLWRKVLEYLLLFPLWYDPSRSWKCSTSRQVCLILTHVHFVSFIHPSSLCDSYVFASPQKILERRVWIEKGTQQRWLWFGTLLMWFSVPLGWDFYNSLWMCDLLCGSL